MNKIVFLLFAMMLPRLAFAYDTATIEQVEEFGIAITSGREHACALMKSGVKCWGSNSAGQLNVPPLSHPRQIAAGELHSCALDDSGVICWGSDLEWRRNVPALSHPWQISVGRYHSCALDDSGVKCWGPNTSGNINMQLSHPRQVSVGQNHTCVLDDFGVKCWGGYGNGIEVPSLSHPRRISAGAHHTCALDDSGIKCWGSSVEGECDLGRRQKDDWQCGVHGQLDVPNLSHPRQISGDAYSCALDDAGLQCWGYAELLSRYGLRRIELSHPQLVSAGGNFMCALDDSGVRCWGTSRHGQLFVPDLAPLAASFALFSLEKSYKKLIEYVDQDKKIILENIAKTIEKFQIKMTEKVLVSYKNGLSRIFTMYLLEILLQETHDNFIKNVSLPGLIQSKADWSRKFDISHIQDIELSSQVLEVSSTLVESGLLAAKTYLSIPQQQDLEDLLMAVAQAKSLSESSPSQSATQLASALDQHQLLLTALIESEQTVGFGKMILAIQSYMKGHHSL